MLSVLLVVLAFNYVDRLVLGLVLQDIKSDLALSDTQLGVLSGIAFALFYSVMGIPIARWADRGNRVTIISIAAALWSVMVALCGVAANFAQLMLIRVGVGVGEAGCIPPAHSLIADYFTRAERPRAVAVYMLGGPLSVVIGNFLAGWLNEFYGWRATFMMLGLPGLVLAVLTRLTLKEPRLQKGWRWAGEKETASQVVPKSNAAATPPYPQSVKDVCLILWTNLTFRYLLFSWVVCILFGAGIGQWQGAFFIRSYGVKTGELGSWFALIYGLGGFLGTYGGGEWASRFAVNDERRQLQVLTLVYSISAALLFLSFLSPDLYLALGLTGLAVVLGAMTNGPMFATIQTLIPSRMRATSIALFYLFANLVGLGLGPLIAGALSDRLRPLLGEESLRYALLALCPGYLFGGWYLWKASKTVTRDLQLAQEGENSDVKEDHALTSALVSSRLGEAVSCLNITIRNDNEEGYACDRAISRNRGSL